MALEDRADRQDRATKVAEADHSVAGIRALDGIADQSVVRPEAAVRRPAGGLDPDLRTGHLTRQFGDPAREIGAMRDNYDANQIFPPSGV
jgi:hypothetical protein